jgi:UDP:flavonoid glycosyltransferase YjiC (YdhE family)
MPRWLRFGIPFNYLTHLFVEQMLWQPSRSQVNRWLTEDLDMEPLKFTGPFGEIYRSDTPLLFAFSKKVYSKPRDWPPHHHITGYWTLEGSQDWQPPDKLRRFLEAGPAPIYAGFGSMPSSRPEEAAEVVLEALRLSGQRGLLLQGWGGLSARDLPEDVHMIEAAPHEWLFARMAAVIHHGGAGTTAAGLRAGVPSIIVPHFSDQPFWGERVRALGVGPRPIPRRLLSAKRLAAAIRKAVFDESMRVRAARLGEELRTEDGVARAVGIIQGHLGRGK